MNKKFALTIIAIGISALASTAGAITVDGTVYEGDFDGDGFAGEISVNYVTFSVTAGTTVVFDVLARENDITDLSGIDVDLNGDGEFTYMDSYLRLFSSTDTELASNDDSVSTFGDGSIHFYDSYLSYTFTSGGNYRIAIGEFLMDTTEALMGFTTFDALHGNVDHADWQMTLTASGGTLSDVEVSGFTTNPVPEPGTNP